MPETKALAANLIKFRNENNQTQAIFAYNCGVSEEEISLLERGKTNPKLSTLQNIASYTGKTVSELLAAKDDCKKEL